MRLRPVAGALALTAALAACGSDPAPPSTLPSLSATPSATPTAAPVPSEAAAATSQGASAFGRYFYEQIEAAFKARDPEMVATISAAECAICQRYVDSIAALRDSNERVDDYDITVLSAEAPAISGDTSRVTVIYNDTASTRRDASGRVLDQEAGRQRVAAELLLAREGDSWIVTEVRRG